MGYLLHIVLALAVLGGAEAGWTYGVHFPAGLLLFLPLPYLVSRLARRAFLRGRFRAGERWIRLQGALPLLSHAAALLVFRWDATVEGWVGRRISMLAWPEPSILLALLPFVVYTLLSIDARARLIAARREEIRSSRAFQARMFLSSFLPLAGYVVLSALVGWNDDVRVQVEEVALYNGAFAVTLLFVLMLMLPTILRTTWETVPIAASPQRDRLLEVARQAGFRARALLMWKTGNTMANAAIVGIGARSRVVLFSDSLLSQLDVRELASVFAHEIGHAVRHHVPIFTMWVVAFFLGADLLVTRFFADSPWLGGAVVLGFAGAWYLAFGWLSRRFELDADLYSLELLGDAPALIGALERVGGRLRDVAGWRHFSTAARVRFLESATDDPRIGARLRRGLRRTTIAGVLVFAILACLEVVRLSGSLGADRVRADLRLGRYASAVERARNEPDLDRGVAALVARAAALETAAGERPPVSELAALARAALRDQDLQAALEWLDLAAMRGDRDLEALAHEIRRRLDPDPGEPEPLAPEIEALWRDELARLPPPVRQ
jgi:Zn-dependent protease with chaperone function